MSRSKEREREERKKRRDAGVTASNFTKKIDSILLPIKLDTEHRAKRKEIIDKRREGDRKKFSNSNQIITSSLLR